MSRRYHKLPQPPPLDSSLNLHSNTNAINKPSTRQKVSSSGAGPPPPPPPLITGNENISVLSSAESSNHSQTQQHKTNKLSRHSSSAPQPQPSSSHNFGYQNQLIHASSKQSFSSPPQPTRQMPFRQSPGQVKSLLPEPPPCYDNNQPNSDNGSNVSNIWLVPPHQKMLNRNEKFSRSSAVVSANKAQFSVPSYQSSLPTSSVSHNGSSIKAHSNNRLVDSNVRGPNGFHKNPYYNMAAVATAAIGGNYGPYSYEQKNANTNLQDLPEYEKELKFVNDAENHNGYQNNLESQYLMEDTDEIEPDDYLHDPEIKDKFRYSICSFRGMFNTLALIFLAGGLIALFAFFPIYSYYKKHLVGFTNDGTHTTTAQVPRISRLPVLIDPDTPSNVKTKVASNNKIFNLVFSDEFNKDGRTFYPGDDPFWEAVDLHYWETGDLEWYDRDAITTKDGYLKITISAQKLHNLNYRSGMLQSWNKLCFTGGIIEVSVSLPGPPDVSGFWPGAWTMGNLGRAGYGATTDGVWPYSYEACDVGILPNQTLNGLPTSAQGLSYLPGQRLSSCTCPGEDHPNIGTGRGSPEIDILEVTSGKGGNQVSQSAQFAPFDADYIPPGEFQIFDTTKTKTNSYRGGIFQQAVSSLTNLTGNEYEGKGTETYSFEYYPGPNGYITWYMGNDKTWTLGPNMIGKNTQTEISNRVISSEPMYIIFNLGMSSTFSPIDLSNLPFPSTFNIDYVRIYQDPDFTGSEYLSCSPPNYPTGDYIQSHINAYTNPELTTWEQAGYEFPKNKRNGGC